MNTVSVCDEDFSFSFLLFLDICKRYVFLRIVSVILNWVCWVRGNFSGGPGHIYSVCVTPLCGVPGRYNFIWRFHGADGGTVQIFFSGSVVAGTVRLKW